MKDRPAGIDESDLAAELGAGWRLAVRSWAWAYLPVGFGSYHWSAVEGNGTAWFVKVDDLGDDGPGREEEFDRLRRSLETALALHRDAALEFVLAPVPTVTGATLSRLNARYALSLFPLVDGAAGEFGPHRGEDLAEMAGLLARLHRATPAVAHLAPRADLRLPLRDRLTTALAELDRPWSGGPYAEPARAALSRHAEKVQAWLADFDRLVTEMRPGSPDWVITHGEPHPGNVIRTGTGLRLIDWTTAQIAPPERDLWMLTSAFTGMLGAGPVGEDEDVLAHYTRLGGHLPDRTGIALHRRWWPLADVAAFLDELRQPHDDGEDATAAFRYLTLNLGAAPERSAGPSGHTAAEY